MLNRRLLLPAFTLLGLVLRLVQLNFQPLWWDEGYSVFFATRDLGTLLARTAIDIHPPLYYILLQVWSDAFGTNDVALRLLSVLIGVVTIPVLYFVARALFNERVALVSAFLCAIAPLPIYYSQEVRMYGLLTLLTLASVGLQLKILTFAGKTIRQGTAWDDGRRTNEGQFAKERLATTSDSPRNSSRRRTTNPMIVWVGYVVVTALALYTEYFAGFVIGAEIVVLLYLVYRAHWRIEIKHWILALAAVGVLYLPWVLYAGPKLYVYVTAKVGIEQYSRLDPLTYVAQHLVAFSMGHVTVWTWLGWGALVFVILAVLGWLVSRQYQMGEGNSQLAIQNSLTALYLFVPLALGFLVNLVYTFHPIHYERLLLFAAPFLFIYVACGIVAMWEREHAMGVLAVGVIVILCALSLYDFYTVPRYPDEDYRPLIQEMEQLAAKDDLVYAFYPWQLGYLETYYHGAPLNIYEVDSDGWITNPDRMDKELGDLRDQNPRAWILAYQIQGRILEDRLTNEYINDYTISDQTFGNTGLEYFAQGNETDFELEPITYSPELTLHIQYAAFDAPTSPHLALARFAWNATNESYAYSLRLVDANGNKVAQEDESIPKGDTTLRRGLALPQNLPAGTYTLQLLAYRRADGSPVAPPNGAAAISLAKVTVGK